MKSQLDSTILRNSDRERNSTTGCIEVNCKLQHVKTFSNLRFIFRHNQLISSLSTGFQLLRINKSSVFSSSLVVTLNWHHPKNNQAFNFSSASGIKINTKMSTETLQNGIESPKFEITNRSAILRYKTGEERFELKLSIDTGPNRTRIFNFNRPVCSSLEELSSRLITNIAKKIKTFEGPVTLLTKQKQTDEKWNEISDLSTPTSTVLKEALEGIHCLSIKIADEVFDVVVNPPEIFSIKFFKQATAGLPIFPNKIEASSNFKRNESKYHWEFSRQPQDVQKSNQPKNKNKGQKTQNPGIIWGDAGCSDFVFVPGEDLIGAKLRLTCHPSDGNCFGLPFSEELSSTVTSAKVSAPLYLERCQRLKEKKEEPNFLRFVTYNCLAECYATEEWFSASPKEALPADFRLPFLCKEFSAYQGDIYCLQEIEDKYFERIFTPYFELTMKFKGFLSSKSGSVNEGVAMFYNPKKLDVIKSETVVIAEHVKTMSMWSQIDTVVGERLQDRNSVLQVTIFRPVKQLDTILIVANTHLYFHPDADHIRLLQTIISVDYLETVATELKSSFPNVRVAVMFCGDFNCTPPYSSFRYLTSGSIQADDFDWTSHPTQKLSPGPSTNHSLELTNSHPNHELTNIVANFEGCIDYILYQSEHFELLNTYAPPDKEKLASLLDLSEPKLVSLPNFYTPSDHLPLVADFLLKSKI